MFDLDLHGKLLQQREKKEEEKKKKKKKKDKKKKRQCDKVCVCVCVYMHAFVNEGRRKAKAGSESNLWSKLAKNVSWKAVV